MHIFHSLNKTKLKIISVIRERICTPILILFLLYTNVLILIFGDDRRNGEGDKQTNKKFGYVYTHAYMHTYLHAYIYSAVHLIQALIIQKSC